MWLNAAPTVPLVVVLMKENFIMKNWIPASIATIIITIAFFAAGTYKSNMFFKMKPILAPAP